jgi:hypothetical protein
MTEGAVRIQTKGDYMQFQTPLPQTLPPYQQGLAPQMPQQLPEAATQTQEVKFYKSGLFGFSSAPGKFQRDAASMMRSGWKLQFAAYLGANIFLRRVIVATWVR